MVLQGSRDNAYMGKTPTDLAKRAIELFNRDFSETPDAVPEDVPEDTRSLYVEEPVIVPLRAALEGGVYSGPDALASFRDESVESWEWLRFDPETFEEIGDRVCLVSGILSGRGRATGAETSIPLSMVMEREGDRIAALRTFLDRKAALEAASA